MKQVRAMLISVVVAILAVGSIPGTAIAGTSSPLNQCATNLSTGRSACFATAAEVTNWAVTIGDVPQGTAAVAPATSFLLGETYEDLNYGGAKQSWFGATACDGNHATWEYEYGTLSSIGWDNRISSFKSFSNCYTKLYENPNYGVGSVYGPYDHATYVGAAMNDQASSIRWY